MKFITPSALLLLTSFSVFSTENKIASPHQNEELRISGFECASNVAELLPLLGRGNDFPQFVAQDITQSLKKQSKHADLVEMRCTSEVRHNVHTTPVSVEGNQREMITGLEVAIPLSIIVINGKQTTALEIEQIYVTTNLHLPDTRKTVPTFKVLSQHAL